MLWSLHNDIKIETALGENTRGQNRRHKHLVLSLLPRRWVGSLKRSLKFRAEVFKSNRHLLLSGGTWRYLSMVLNCRSLDLISTVLYPNVHMKA
jgi:hypothetical protein